MQDNYGQRSVSERISAVIDDGELLRDIRALEKAANARFVHASTNGRIDQAFKHAGRGVAVAFAIASSIFFFGGHYERWKTKVDSIPVLEQRLTTTTNELAVTVMELRSVKEELRQTRRDLDAIERADEWYRRNRPNTPRLPGDERQPGGGS